MSKCATDIKFDIIDNVRGKLQGEGLIATSKQTMEVTNPNRANVAMAKVNQEFGENIAQFSSTSNSAVYIEPSNALVDRYYQKYLDDMGFRQLNDEERARGGYADEHRGEFYQFQGNTVTSGASAKTLAAVRDFL